MLHIRPAELQDAPALGTIMSRSFHSAFTGFISRETLDACAREENCILLMQQLLSAGEMRFLLGLRDDTPMGELVWSPGDTPAAAEIQAIHSLPESWGTGLGAALLNRAFTDMAADGRTTVSLWAFRENHRARRFYEKHGFTFTGETRTSDFDQTPEVRYTRPL